jgi:hypothetical protein
MADAHDDDFNSLILSAAFPIIFGRTAKKEREPERLSQTGNQDQQSISPMTAMPVWRRSAGARKYI